MRIILLTLLMILLPFVSSQAATDGLYTGVTTVSSQLESERKKALPSALLQVLQKLSGMREIDDQPMLDGALKRAASLMVSFHYRQAEKILADGSEVDELRLVVNFSEPDVDDIMKELQLPLWEPQRQAIEVWVLVDDGLDRRILPVEYAYAWNAMDEAAVERGLPLLWPEADEEGEFSVDEQLLWGGYTEDLAELGSSAVMVAAARREGPEWNVRINLAYGAESWTWRNRDVDLQWVLADSIQQAADNIAQAHTIAAADQGRQVSELTIGGIGGAADYARCLAYLQNLTVVERVSVVFAQAGLIRFSLELNALPLYLENVLSTSNTLEFVEAENRYVLKK